jgi:hypothetical protein
VDIYLKGGENIVRFEEWLAKDSVKWTLTTLDRDGAGEQAEGGKAVWRDAPGKWVVRAYRSDVDWVRSALRGSAPARLRQRPEERNGGSTSCSTA